MQENNNAVKIAVMEEQIRGVRDQQKAHNETTQKRFDELNTKVDELLAALNRGKGAYTASLLLAGAIGAIVIAGVQGLTGWFHR